nr:MULTISPECIES: YHYH domain-containing protein [unclassified Paenibacillus]
MLSLLFSSVSIAHSGRTDSSGGHNCSAKSISKGLCSGYHYHNGGSSSSSGKSSSSTSTSSSYDKPYSSPSYTTPIEVIPEGYVKAAIPSFSVVVNGQSVSNSLTRYPVIEYKDITYFPMTWNYTQALGIETKWDNEIGFVIRKTDNKAADLVLDYGSTSSKLDAKGPDFNVFVNDVWIDNSKEQYPILVLNDVTYFPMTWYYAVDELGLTIKFENNTFYISK